MFTKKKAHLEVSGERVADLTLNPIANDGLDAAICKLTPDGFDLATESLDTDTWLRHVHVPSATDNTEEVTFYPTHAALPSFVERVESFAADEEVGGIPFNNLIALRECTLEGDSVLIPSRSDG